MEAQYVIEGAAHTAETHRHARTRAKQAGPHTFFLTRIKRTGQNLVMRLCTQKGKKRGEKGKKEREKKRKYPTAG